jgi:predicted ATPase/signal transduction histidine kinase
MALIMDLTGCELEPLRDDGEFALYRARQPSNPVPVLALVAARPTSRTIARLENEYALAAVLDPSWAARPLALNRHKGPTTLLLEDNGGDPLDRALGRPLALTRFLRLAINLSTAVGEVHRHGLIHKDIKPANLLVDSAGNVRLTGFGIASRLPHERQHPAPPETIAGTFAYMAPEQTGRMNRSTDGRSDLYSLGVTLYEMLTGALPFTASDPMEWIHCHIARRPTPPSQRVSGIPGPVEAIILKLLAKTAEDRYQTAAGVAAELRRCLTEWERTGSIEAFPLGAHDVPDVLRIPEKLYGREDQVGLLLAAFDRVVSRGTPELVLVSGYSGIGKSAVVHELHKAIVPPRGLFASGKFDQYKRDIPYTTLAQAFQTLAHQILVQSDAEVDQWRCALAEAVGPNGQLIVSLIPEVELIIGKQPPVPDLPAEDAQNRFQSVFRRFLGVFARPEHPLALFLDDLQWLDAATLDLLEHLVTHSEVRHLLLVGAYRDNEVSPSHPLSRALEVIRTTGARVQEIVLAPLAFDDVGQLVADALHSEPERVRPLAHLVQEKTGGNPFFAIQFFTALAEEGLLSFDPVAPAWQWDINRIRAKSYTDNVVDLMAGKLKRFSGSTQEALKQLACLGNAAPTATLALIHGETEEAMHAALWEAVHAGLVLREDSAYKFLHDRIQQAAYTLIPEERRAEVHLRIGRMLLTSMTADELAEHLFDVANQFRRGAARLLDRDEKARVATIDLRAGRKAKASAAFASACVHLAAGMAQLDEGDWGSQHDLMFSLRLERAECELLSGNFDKAEQLIGELLQRGTSKVDQAATYYLKAVLHTVKSENAQAVASALTCLRLFGIDLPAHPTWEQVQAEYETVWQTLNGRPIESLIDLPLMTDPELQAAMQVLSVCQTPAKFTDFHLWCLLGCRMVKVSMQHGTSGASAHAYGYWGSMLGPVFHRYSDAYRFVKLACHLVEKHGFIAYHAKVYHATGTVAFWTQPIGTAIDFMRATFRTATETGGLTYACYSMCQSVHGLLLRNDPLDAVWRESERGLDFVRKAGFRDMADAIVSQQRFIATMQGRTATFSTFSDAQFDETAFEAQLMGDRTTTMVCLYWIVKLKTRFLSGDYAEALAAADKAKALLWASAVWIQLLDYFYYAALTVTALYEKASVDEQNRWHDLLMAHREQLREWADSYPPTFADKHALVSAEIARLEGQDADAMRLYEQAIRSAREHGFVQNEGLAHEVAARFYTARGLDTIGHSCLRNARDCYDRWGALGKVKQLEQSHPHLRQEPASLPSDNAIGTPVEHLDLATVVKVSQAVSSEIDLRKLTDRLMVTALEHAGAARGLLILSRGEGLRIEAEATIVRDAIEVRLRQARVAAADLPDSILHYVIRTGDSLLLDDASDQSPFSEDEYVRQNHSRSILCLPLLKQAKLIGILYFENNLASHVFTPARIAVLRLLASQAAISLENARLYTDLQRAEAVLAEAQRLSHTGSFGWRVSSGEILWSEQSFKIFGYEPVAKATIEMALNRAHPDDVALIQRVIDRAVNDKQDYDLEHRLLLPDGSVKHIQAVAHATRDDAGELEFVGAVMDVTAAKRAGEQLHQAQAELAHVTRVTALGELTASIAHEIKQPLAAVVASAGAGLRWLASQPPDLEAARRALGRIVRDGHRAGEVLDRIRALIKKAPPKRERVDVNEIISETIALTRPEAQQNGVALQTELANELPLVPGDRIQLQQVILNLIVNGIEAMSGDGAERRELLVVSAKDDANGVRVAVRDSGPGLEKEDLDRLFDAFYTTKPLGMGMGLAISRTIIGSHGGRLWATPNVPQGAIFQFRLPIDGEEAPSGKHTRSPSQAMICNATGTTGRLHHR